MVHAYDGTMPTWSTSGTLNPANIWNMRITYAPPSTPVYLEGLANITYGATTTAYCASENPCSLFRNGTNITDSENATAAIVGVGGWFYKANETAGNSTERWLVVSQADTAVQLWLNGTAADRNYTQYDIANFTCELNTTGTAELNSSYNPFTNQSGASPIEYLLNLTDAGDDVPVEAFFPGNSTHNPSSAMLHFNITAFVPPTTTTTTVPPTTTTAPPGPPDWSNINLWYALALLVFVFGMCAIVYSSLPDWGKR